MDRFLGLSILQGKDPADAFKLVETGKAAAFMDDDVLLVDLKASAKNPDCYSFLDESFPGATYALVMRKDDKAFKELVDGVLAETMKSGEYAKIYAKWFESPDSAEKRQSGLSHAGEAEAAHQRPRGDCELAGVKPLTPAVSRQARLGALHSRNAPVFERLLASVAPLIPTPND